jgi:hypothetical protein
MEIIFRSLPSTLFYISAGIVITLLEFPDNCIATNATP